MSDKVTSTPKSFFWHLVVVLAPTVILGMVSYVYATLDSQRKDRLDFVRGQIVDLYGPLYTLTNASETVWFKLGIRHKLQYDPQNPPTNDKVLLWRKMLAGVVEPLNDQIEKTLLSSKQTIRCPVVRDALHQYVVFAESVKLVVLTWKGIDDFSDKTQQGNEPEGIYPRCLSARLSAELDALHVREKKLDNGFFGPFVGLLERHDEPECAPVVLASDCVVATADLRAER